MHVMVLMSLTYGDWILVRMSTTTDNYWLQLLKINIFQYDILSAQKVIGSPPV